MSLPQAVKHTKLLKDNAERRIVMHVSLTLDLDK